MFSTFRRWLTLSAPAVGLIILLGFIATSTLGEPSFSAGSPTPTSLRVTSAIQSAPTVEPTATPSPSPTPAPSATSTATAQPAAPAQGMIVVGSEADQSLALVDASSLRVTRTVHLGIPVRSIVVGPDHHTVWAFSANPSETDVHLFDLASGQQTTTRLNGPPRSVAFSADGQRAFVTVGDPARVTFLGTAHQDNLGQITIGQQSPGMQLRRLADALTIARQSSSEVLYVAGRGSGLIWAIDARSGRLLQEIPIGGGPLAILADPSGQQLYAVVDTLDQLVTVDPTTGIVSSRVALPGRPTGAAIDSAGNIYITGGDAGAVWVVDRTSRLVQDTIAVGQSPTAIAVSRDRRWAYVANQRSDTLSVVDLARRRVTASIPVGHGPTAVALAPSQPSLAAAIQPPASTIKLPTVVPTPTPSSQHSPTEHLPPGTIKETVVTGVDYPAAMAFAPDGRLFFTEVQTGQIRIVKNGVLLPDPFYTFDVAQQPETGLLGLALDPHFAQNHFVYVFYTQKAAGGLAGPNQLVRLTDVNDKGTHLTPILANLPSGPIHDAGRLRFGPDGKLYVSIGETDRMGDSQDLGSLAGKILRINPDGSIPSDNPFVGQKGRQPAVWAYGLRNSFGFDFHPITRAMFATENGPGDNDELDLIVRGGNYGWPPSGFQDKAGLIDPIAVYNPVIAPTGLAFYRSSQIPQWTDDLFYCNYHEGQLRRIRLAPESFDRIADEEVVTPGCTLDVESGPDGALYYSDLHAIYRIRSATAPALPTVASRRVPAPRPTTLPAGTRPQDRDLNVDLTEWQITLSRAKAPAGPLRFVVANLGHTDHALRIVGHGVDERTATIQPRQTIVWEITLPAGTYQVTCPIGNHAQQGMTTSLTVLPTNSAAPVPTPGAHPGTASPGPTP